ncbi:MAG: LapA family protein [Mariprofundaceae bacterium]|nr:LapA family protein [Mariprofundaceae bacterium]
MNWINVLVVLVLTSFATMFALSNMDPVQIAIAGLTSDHLPLFIPIFVAFLLGFLGGMLSLSFSRRKHKQEIADLHKENALLNREVENLRNIPLQDDV